VYFFFFLQNAPSAQKTAKRSSWLCSEYMENTNTLHKQGQDGRMKFKHSCGQRNLPKKLEEQQVNAGGSASPSSLASWGRDETDVSCVTSDEAVSGKQGIHKRDAKKQRPARNESFLCEQVVKALTIKKEARGY
jgi:hypothetical protein